MHRSLWITPAAASLWITRGVQVCGRRRRRLRLPVPTGWLRATMCGTAFPRQPRNRRMGG